MKSSAKKSKTAKKFNRLVADLYAKYKSITLPPEYAYFIEDNLLRFTIRLARYKFPARLIRPEDKILEVGCGSGLGAIFLSQHCRSVKGIDVNQREISEARRINRRANITFEVRDLFKYPKKTKHDVIVALDVIEHMEEESGRRFIAETAGRLHNNGMLILGTPSRYSYRYQGALSKAAHIKLYDQGELVNMVEKYYGRAIAFSMNDEVVHTGFSKMAWYYFVLGFCPGSGL